MDDLIERLRDGTAYPGFDGARSAPLMYEAANELATLRTERDALRAALTDADFALAAWLHTYAAEPSSRDEVIAAAERIDGGGGTIAYIARTRAVIGRCLAAQEKQG